MDSSFAQAFKQELDHMEPPQDPVMAAPVEELPLAKEELPQVDALATPQEFVGIDDLDDTDLRALLLNFDHDFDSRLTHVLLGDNL